MSVPPVSLRRHLPKVLLVCCLLAVAGPSRAQETWSLLQGEAGDAVEIRADSLIGTADDSAVEASGEVRIAWRGMHLQADRVTYQPRQHIATAAGNVVLEDDAGNRLQCRRLRLNTRTEQGEIEDGTLWLVNEGYRIWGEHLVKSGKDTYEVERGGFTACDGTWPSWRVEARRVEVEVEGFLIARGASFWVEGVPLLYTPYVVFPVKLKRQSGFLLPKVGYTSGDGAYLALRYYWAIADHADATFQASYRSQRGWEEQVQLRYVLSEGHAGSLEGSHLDDRADDARRYRLRVDHRSRFENAAQARLNVDYVGDTDYAQDLGEDLDERGVARKRSYAVASHDVGVGSVFALGQFFQTLTAAQSEVQQTLPSLGLWGREVPLAQGWAWSPSVRAGRFWRARGERGERLELAPRLAASWPLGGVGVTVRGGYRQHLYRTAGHRVSHGGADAAVVADATAWKRLGGFLHEIAPRLQLRWEEAGRGGSAPQFDAADVFEHRTVASLLLENRFWHWPELAALFTFDLEGRYDLGAAGWLPVRGELQWQPAEEFLLHGDAEYDPRGEDRLLRWAVRGEAQDGRGDRLLLGYRYRRGVASYLDAGVEVPLHRILTLQYRNRYSYKDATLLEEVIALQLLHPCWALNLSYSRNWLEDEDAFEQRYFAQLELSGFGRIGKMKGILP